MMSQNETGQVEREEFMHKFETWSGHDQVEFVERLLEKMAHCQHKRIDAALQPLLERDFITMLPNTQTQNSTCNNTVTAHNQNTTINNGINNNNNIKNCSNSNSTNSSSNSNNNNNSPINGTNNTNNNNITNTNNGATNCNGASPINNLTSASPNIYLSSTNAISQTTNSTSLTESIKSCYEKWSLGGAGLADLASVSGSDSPVDPDSIFGGSPLGPVVSAHSHHHNVNLHADSHPGAIGAPHPSRTGIHFNAFNTNSDNHLHQQNHYADSLISLSNKLMNNDVLLMPIKSQCKRQKMIYHCKFGEFGVMDGQFTEPSGVAVNAQNDIIVADTNNHRIQIFDKEGRFKFQFGECGKRDGQLLYPNRVAVVRSSGDIIVTERSPTHQIQVYNQYGQFVRKFGANILQHPRGVTVDNKGRIIVVECKVMRVIIFDQLGNALHKFGCSKHLEFPNGVVVNDKQEIFISDNRAHCVKVFSYEGQFLRQIGGEGLTNYPIGVCINDVGEILVADNHNNFNITIFNQNGNLVSALESKVKHAQCFDVALMDDNSVVLASKDYRIYIYRYLQVQAINALAFEKQQQ